jgi:hypothetical protein
MKKLLSQQHRCHVGESHLLLQHSKDFKFLYAEFGNIVKQYGVNIFKTEIKIKTQF